MTTNLISSEVFTLYMQFGNWVNTKCVNIWNIPLGTLPVLIENARCPHWEQGGIPFGNAPLMSTHAGNIRHSHLEQLLFSLGTLNVPYRNALPLCS